MAKIAEKRGNEKHTQEDMIYSEEKRKSWKMRNVHCRTWNMAEKLKIMENVKNPLYNLKNDEITEKT